MVGRWSDITRGNIARSRRHEKSQKINVLTGMNDRNMTKRITLLDLFCGAGGAAMGYHRAGFEVVGIDINPQPNYPFEFHRGDALEYLAEHGHEFDAIHASPPCQHYSIAQNAVKNAEAWPDLIPEVRLLLQATERPYVIENVIGAPLQTTIMLCGSMFGLRTYRHRNFESNIFLWQIHHSKHITPSAKCGRIPRGNEFWSPVGKFGGQDEAQKSMGIDWMQTGVHDPREIAEAIPPAYTEYIGKQLMNYFK